MQGTKLNVRTYIFWTYTGSVKSKFNSVGLTQIDDICTADIVPTLTRLCSTKPGHFFRHRLVIVLTNYVLYD